MANNRQQVNGIMDNGMIEVKIEPGAAAVDGYGDDENENGFAGFDNSNTIPSTADVGALNLWTSRATSCLISQYKKYHSMVGQTTRLRSLREMFETISVEMQKFGFYFSPQKCENKWRVLERKYKNLVFRERLKKPGRIRHYGHWEHKRALDEIFNEKKRHMYLDESDFPPPSGSAKFAQKAAIKEAASMRSNAAAAAAAAAEQAADNQDAAFAQNLSPGPQKSNHTCNKVFVTMFETFLTEMRKKFAQAEANRERRHNEEMAMRRSALEVQTKILKLKEQKIELRKMKITSAAQYFHLTE